MKTNIKKNTVQYKANTEAKQDKEVQETKKERKKIREIKNIKQDCLTIALWKENNFFLHEEGSMQILT